VTMIVMQQDKKLCLSQFVLLRYSCTVGKYLDKSFIGHWFSYAITIVHLRKRKINEDNCSSQCGLILIFSWSHTEQAVQRA